MKMRSAPTLWLVACLLALLPPGSIAASVAVSQVRLAGGNATAGRVEVLVNGQWGTVCNDFFDSNAATVTCRMLGYSAGSVVPEAAAPFNFGQGTGLPILMDNVRCNGSEDSLAACSADDNTLDCSHVEDTGVACSNVNASSTGTVSQVRLAGGPDGSAGRVEVLVDGTWGTVCDDFFDNNAATVACRMLGYASGAAVLHATSHFGQGSGGILLDQVRCNGTESSLAACSSNPNTVDCTHQEDAGVLCSSGPAAPPPSSSGGGLSAGAIAGIAVGAAVVVAAAAAAGWVYTRRRRHRKADLPGPVTKPQDLLSSVSSSSDDEGPKGGGKELESIEIVKQYGKGLAPVNVSVGGAAAAATAAAAAAAAAQLPSIDEHPTSAARQPAPAAAAATDALSDEADASAAFAGDAAEDCSLLAALRHSGSVPTTPSAPSAVGTPPTASLNMHPSSSSEATEAADTLALLTNDPLLSLIASHTAVQSAGSAGRSGGSGGSKPSGKPRAASGLLDVAHSWELEWGALTFVHPIGEGSFGKVYLASWQGIQVAAKVLFGPGSAKPGNTPNYSAALALPLDLLDRLEEEAGLMSTMRHPNICAMYGICTAPAACIVTEFCSNGSLTSVLQQARRDPAAAAQLTWPRRLSFARDAALGMRYLHGRTPPIIHRDLKSPNLLVDKHWQVKVCDFNLSRLMAGDGLADDLASKSASSLTAVNPRWLAPELMQGKRATQASDAFAFAVIMWELLTWEVPWPDANPFTLPVSIINGTRLAIPPLDQLPGSDTAAFGGLAAYVSLMRRCWAPDPTERPTFAQAAEELEAMLEVARATGHVPS